MIVDFFTGNVLEARQGKVTTIRTGFRGADGIDLDRQGNIYLSSWTDGKLWRISPNPLAKDNPKVLIDGLKSAADVYVDDDGKHVIFPDMTGGSLIFIPIR